MKISDGFHVMFLLTIHAIFYGACRTLIYGSTDFPCEEDDNCLSNLPVSISTSQKITSTDVGDDSTPNSNINESLNQSDREIFFHSNSTIRLDCPRLGPNHERFSGKYRWTKIKPNVEIVVLSEGAELLRRTHLQLTENKTHYVVTIRNAKVKDVGSYQCTIGDSIIIQTIHVYMIKEPVITSIEPLSKPHLHSSNPNVRLFNLSTQMILVCFVEGYPPPDVTWSRPGGQPLPVESQLIPDKEFSTFIIANIQLEHAGIYVCFANDSLDQVVKKEIEVIVQFRPSATSSKSLLRKSLNDEYVTLECKVNAIPNATFEWLKDGAPIDRSRDKKQIRFPVYCEDDGLMKFVLKIVKPRDYGNYTCLATNRLGNDSSFIILSARPVAPIIISDPIGLMMYKYILQWHVNTTFRLPPVTMFKIQYKLDAEIVEQNTNKSDKDSEWKYIEYNVPRKEDPQENDTFNVTLINLRKNSTYFVYIEAINAIKPSERGDAAFFQFKTSASIVETTNFTRVSNREITKTTPGAVPSNKFSTDLRNKTRKPSTFDAPTNPSPETVWMTPVVYTSNNDARHIVLSSSIAVLVGVVICKLILL
ncbi:neural cell adhesion molecule 1-like isoform X2 [Anneissia japonica]|uniref:neural cell adhesion molecule 1-like isoform X2 n=1 Tax=Anneissia japonica TaxID=1529436 RepID=UPI0014259BB8|nr:neural cell adhesion molecule 1-like isoform X2 [Anneissia japonica]